MLADSKVREAYSALDEEFSLAHELIAARVRAGLTQTELAQRMGTTQSAIARSKAARGCPASRRFFASPRPRARGRF